MFTQDDIARARKFAKRAAAGELAKNPYEYNTLANYPDWFPSSSVLKPPPQRYPGFWSSAADTALGYGGYLADPIRSAVGLSPGRSMLRNWGRGAMSWLGGKVFNETTPEWKNFEAFGEGPNSINMGFLNKPLRVLNPAVSWINSKVREIDPNAAWAARQYFGPQGWMAPLGRAEAQSERNRGALGRYAEHEFPAITRMVTEPKKYFEELESGPMEF